MSWHKSLLCGSEYRDDTSESRFGYCPGCREHESGRNSRRAARPRTPGNRTETTTLYKEVI